MGNCNFAENPHQETEIIENINHNYFLFHYVIGRGGFGKVWKVEHKKTKQQYALKEMDKAKIITKKSVGSVMNEKTLLCTLNHPFIINMVWAFQDKEKLYLAMDLLQGGDLRYHLSKRRRFSEKQTQFIAACIILALEYLHLNGIIHRDIKPENIVLDKNGYMRVTDLGVARIWKPENSHDTSGTPGYMAPEIMCRQNHGVASDYYALGVIVYECMMGTRPYLGRNRKEIRDQILARQVQIKKQDIPPNWSLEAADFVNKCIQRKPSNRLGVDGPDEVKDHPWFQNFDWDKLSNKEIEAPFVPDQEGENFDSRQVNGKQAQLNKTEEELMKQNELLLKKESIQALFQGYEYDNSQFNSTKSSAGFTQVQTQVSTKITK